MMRKIKFRYHFTNHAPVVLSLTDIANNALDNLLLHGEAQSVRAICQFTGLKDKNGEMIFEGDIIEWLNKKWEIKVDQAHGIRFLYGIDQITKGVADNCEVIGNIHENPNP